MWPNATATGGAEGGGGSTSLGDGVVGASVAPLIFAVVVSSWIVTARLARGKAHKIDDVASSPPHSSPSASPRPVGRKPGRAALRHGRHARWLAHVVPALLCEARDGVEIWDLDGNDDDDEGKTTADTTYWDLTRWDLDDHDHDSDPDSETDAAPAPPPTPLLSTLDLFADGEDDADSSDGCLSGCATPRATPR